mgnify:FL=1
MTLPGRTAHALLLLLYRLHNRRTCINYAYRHISAKPKIPSDTLPPSHPSPLNGEGASYKTPISFAKIVTMDIYNPTGCEDKEPFALRVIGESMTPEFNDGATIIIDPGYPTVNGAYVVVLYQKEYHFRQLVRRDEKVYLAPLNSNFHSLELEGHYQIVGVVTQQNYKRDIHHYEYPKDGEIIKTESERSIRRRERLEKAAAS